MCMCVLWSTQGVRAMVFTCILLWCSCYSLLPDLVVAPKFQLWVLAKNVANNLLAPCVCVCVPVCVCVHMCVCACICVCVHVWI